MTKQTYVISLGGSLIAPEGGIDWKFLKKFRQLIMAAVKRGNRFVIITGGGITARSYQAAAAKVIRLTRDDRDWLGIHATRLNAHLIKTIFRTVAHPRINKNPRTQEDLAKHFEKGEGVMLAAGWRPGWSTDYVAAILAGRLGATTIINLSNIDYVYDKDPKKFNDAIKLPSLGYEQALQDHIKVMDDTSIALAKENKLPIIVCDMFTPGNLLEIIQGNLSRCSIVK